MKKTDKQQNIAKLIGIILPILVVFALFCCAVWRVFAENGGRDLPLLRSGYKYVLVGLVFALLLFAGLFALSACRRSTRTDLITPAYFGINFKKLDRTKKKLQSVELDVASGAMPAPESVRAAAKASGTVAQKPQADALSADGESEEPEHEGSRFYMLTEIDKEYEHYVQPEYDDEIDLKTLCEEFRSFAARKLKLYYCIEDIRRFIGAIAVTKLIILQGMSGTGKTSLAYAFGEFMENKTVVVPIQPMWKERTDLVGYYNEFTRRFNETTLLYKMYEANNNDEIYITVLDEMNIARVEYYFAEFLSLLEIPNPDGRNIDVVSDRWEDDPKLLQKNGQLRLPTNMWYVGTANNDDSTFAISDKVYDRAMVLNLDKKAIPFDGGREKGIKVSAGHLEALFARAQREYAMSDRNERRVKALDEYMIKTFHITFGNRIMKQIRAYVPVLVACGGTETEALDDILARKVFRKLEAKNPVYVKQAADGVCSYLDELFGEDGMPQCKEAIRLIEQNV